MRRSQTVITEQCSTKTFQGDDVRILVDTVMTQLDPDAMYVVEMKMFSDSKVAWAEIIKCDNGAAL